MDHKVAPTRILKFSNKDISDQLKILFNQSLSSGIFHSILETSKITPRYKKDVTQNVQTPEQFRYFLTLSTFLKNSCITDFIVILKKRTHRYIHKLVFERNIKVTSLLFILKIRSGMRLIKLSMLMECLQNFKKHLTLQITI